jgi:hypothetical protein
MNGPIHVVSALAVTKYAVSSPNLPSTLPCYLDYRFPFVAISIGLTINQEPVVGVIYNPILNQVRNYCYFYRDYALLTLFSFFTYLILIIQVNKCDFTSMGI